MKILSCSCILVNCISVPFLNPVGSLLKFQVKEVNLCMWVVSNDVDVTKWSSRGLICYRRRYQTIHRCYCIQLAGSRVVRFVFIPSLLLNPHKFPLLDSLFWGSAPKANSAFAFEYSVLFQSTVFVFFPGRHVLQIWSSLPFYDSYPDLWGLSNCRLKRSQRQPGKSF